MGWLLAIVAGGLLTFNAVVTPDRAASEAKKALQKQFPDAEIQVEIDGKRGKDVLNGRFRSIDIDLANLTLTELPLSVSGALATTPVAGAPGAPAIVREPDGAIIAGEVRPQSAPKYQPVKIKTPKPEKIKIGSTGELNIAVRNFKWQNLSVERAKFEFADVEYDFGALKSRSEFKLVRLGQSKMHLELAPTALTPFIAKKVENVTNASVLLNNGQMTVKGARNFGGVAAPFEVVGTPDFAGAEMILKAPKLLVSGFTVPNVVSTPILKNVNPLYSFDRIEGFPFKVKLTKVEARDGKLQIDGDLTLK